MCVCVNKLKFKSRKIEKLMSWGPVNLDLKDRQSLLPLKDCCSEPVLDLVLVLHMQFAVQEQKQFVSNLLCMPATVFSGLKIIHVLVTAWLDCCRCILPVSTLEDVLSGPLWSNMWPKGCLWPTGSLWLPL